MSTAWSPWVAVDLDPHSGGAIRETYPDGRLNPNHGFVAGGLVSWGLERYRFLRYRITLAAEGDASPALAALRIYYQDSTLDGRHEPVPRPVAPRAKAGGLSQPFICDRACWAARAPQCGISQMPGLDRAVIHHTASSSDWSTTSAAASAANVRAHQNFHMDGNGWCDLGYNFLVDKLGNNFEGRQGSISSLAKGAHDGINDDSIGVALMGFLHSPHNQVPTQAMRDAAYDVIAWKVPDPFDGYGSSAYGTLGNIGFLAGHRDVKATACPGDQMYAFIGTDFFGGDARDGVNGRITGPSIPCCPETPTLGSVTSDGNGSSLTATWSDVGPVANYNVYVSSDGTTFGAPIAVASGTTSHTLPGIPSGQARYVRVTAVGGSQESPPSDVYGAVAGTSSRVLIVDGNDRWNFQTGENPTGANHDFAVTTALAMAGTSFDTADNAGVESGSVSLAAYEAVVWILGEESTAQETFSTQEQGAVATYLDGGGRLFVSGAEIGWDLVAKGGTADQTFYQTYLKATYLADDAATYDVDIEPGGLYDGLAPFSFQGGVMNVAFPDEIAVAGGSRADLRYATGDVAGISFDGAFRVVHLGFPLETVNSAADHSSILGRALDFLLGGSSGCPAGAIDFSSFPLASYTTQNVSNNTTVLEGGNTLQLRQNTWVRSVQTFNVTPSTVIEFEYASSDQGEIHGFGFDENDNYNDQSRHFQIYGTQAWSDTGKVTDWAPVYAGSGAFRTYRVPVGRFYTGGALRLAFLNDDDAGPSSESRFRCVRVYEGNPCVVAEDFEAGAAGWFIDAASTCSTGDYVVGNPTVQSSGGVTTQPGGSFSGTGSVFTASNTSAGVHDVDGGNCRLGSPTWAVTNDAVLSVAWWHGQRDAGDDTGDFFRLEYSVDGGGSWTTLRSAGDVASNAAWDVATAAVPAGSDVEVRVQCSDGAATGDIVECGIDDVLVCEQ